jgi:hypothetical protein
MWRQIFSRKSSKILKTRRNIVGGKAGRLMKLMGKGRHSATKWFKKDRFSHCINHPIAADRQRYIFTLLFLQNILLQKNLDGFDPKIFFSRRALQLSYQLLYSKIVLLINKRITIKCITLGMKKSFLNTLFWFYEILQLFCQ